MAQAQDVNNTQTSSPEGIGVVQNSTNPLASLYVGDLDGSVTETQLFEKFGEAGSVLSVRVCRDVRTRASLGYAYVNFSEPAHAAKAIEDLNFFPLNGKPIRVMHSNRDASTRIINEANLFVKHLDKSVSNNELYEAFKPFGTILSCKIVLDSNSESKGYGFVQFDSIESAQNAIKNLNGTLLNEKALFVGPFVSKQERGGTGPVTDMTKFSNLFVKNLSENANEDNLNEIFGQFGKITSSVVMKDEDGNSKCFGFVNFENSDEAAKAVEALNGKIFDGKEWFVGKAMKKSEREREMREMRERANMNLNVQQDGTENKDKNLYMKNLDEDVGEDKLREVFSQFGTITSCKIMRDETGKSRGAGFVSFESHEEATKAINEMSGKVIGTKPLYLAFAENKEERRARLQEQLAKAISLNALNLHMPLYPPQFLYGQHSGFVTPPGGYGVPPMRAGNPMTPPYAMQMSPPPGGPRGPRPRRQNNNNFNQAFAPRNHNQMSNPRGSNNNRNYNNNGSSSSSSSNNNNNNNNNNGNERGGGSGMRLREFGARNDNMLTSALAKSSPNQQRMMLGENLYPLVNALEPEFASKITGMLLEMDQTEVLNLIESPRELKMKVSEAMIVLGMENCILTRGAPSPFGSLSLNS